jgi:mannose-1-phosphate guanylyltransferase / mannose-6-phosphate isomerase
MNIIPVILCGGSGTRLWPMSRGALPKQYLKLTSDKTLVQQTALRLRGKSGISAPLVITGHEHRFLVAQQLREVDVVPSSIVLEPAQRNTAPAVAVAALLAIRQSPDALLLVLPSDHVVQHEAAFDKRVATAAQVANGGLLVTFGIRPTEAHFGYGYIRSGAPLAGNDQVFKVDAFVEKPDLITAQRFVQEGNYYWNSGMFMMKASAYIEELRNREPEIARFAEQAVEIAVRDDDCVRLDPVSFAKCPSMSIDYALMEKTNQAAVIVATDLGWSDIGSWTALAELARPDEHGNAVVGDVMTEDVTRSYIRADHRMVAAIGLDDIVIVETADAVLVAHRDKVQDVKKIVERLNASGRDESVTHRRVVRPWGSYEEIDQGARFQVKRIIVNPGAQLSLQMHHHRAEHWIVVKGTALVTNGNSESMLTENQSTYIPLGVAHRLRNPGKIPLELIEVQSGAYLGEDDIVRFEDVYGRVSES